MPLKAGISTVVLNYGSISTFPISYATDIRIVPVGENIVVKSDDVLPIVDIFRAGKGIEVHAKLLNVDFQTWNFALGFNSTIPTPPQVTMALNSHILTLPEGKLTLTFSLSDGTPCTLILNRVKVVPEGEIALSSSKISEFGVRFIGVAPESGDFGSLQIGEGT